ncbi:MAG TPA: hypothetical protein VF179_27160 [Thermoanaerobaculia bacterium]|nr:hypothetical protein [Thermoanaerobaculia bacterium]
MRPKTSRRLLVAASLTLFALPVFAGLAPKGTELRVNSRTDFKQRNPATAFSASGSALVVWENDQKGLRALFYGKNGQPAGAELTLIENSSTPGSERIVNRREPAIAFLSENTIGVAWTEETANLRVVPFLEQRDILDRDIYFQRFNGAGVPVGERIRVNTATAGFQSHPRLITRGGGVLVVWEDADGGIYGRWLGGSGGEQFKINEAAGTGVAIAASTAGNNRYIAVWEGQDESETGVFARVFDNAGKAVGSEFRVNTDTAGRQRRPAVAADASGNFMVVWQTDLAKTESHLFAQLLGSGGNRIGGQRALNAGAESGMVQMAPAVVASAPDRFLVTWLAWPNNRAGLEIAGREFDAAGAAQGAAFWVSENRIERNFRRTSVSTDGKGGFLVTWETVIGRSQHIGARRLLQ